MAENQLDNIFPELYYDIIARLIPGFAVVYIYSSVPNDWVFTAKMIPVAYLIGMVPDILSNLVVHVPIDRILKSQKKFIHLTDQDIWTSLLNETPENQRILKKKCAEIVFFRSTFCFVVLQILLSLCLGIKSNKLQSIQYYYPLFLLSAFVLLICFCRTIFLLRRDRLVVLENQTTLLPENHLTNRSTGGTAVFQVDP